MPRDWDRKNWESTIRKHVTILADYAAMEKRNGHEAADLMDHDKQGNLTAVLADRSYLDPQNDGWRDARPSALLR